MTQKRKFSHIEFVEPAPRSEDPTPTTPAMLKAQATVGALLGICGCADSLIRQGKLDRRLYQSFGIPALNRMYQEVDKLNRHFEKIWKSHEADQMGYLHTDTAIILMVLASVDLESRTNVANEFRKIWAKLLENLGDTNVFANTLKEIAFIREQRGLPSIEDLEAENTKQVFNTLSFFKDGQKTELGEIQDNTPKAVDMLNKAMQTAKEFYLADDPNEFTQRDAAQQLAQREPQPNCMILVWAKDKKQLIAAQVAVKWGDQETKDMIEYDPNGYFFREYPQGVVITFSAFADGYLPGGCEKMFFEGDPEQLVVNIYLTPVPQA